VRRLPKAALSLLLVLRSRIRDCLPLQVGDGIGTAAGKRHNVIFDVAGAGADAGNGATKATPWRSWSPYPDSQVK